MDSVSSLPCAEQEASSEWRCVQLYLHLTEHMLLELDLKLFIFVVVVLVAGLDADLVLQVDFTPGFSCSGMQHWPDLS